MGLYLVWEGNMFCGKATPKNVETESSEKKSPEAMSIGFHKSGALLHACVRVHARGNLVEVRSPVTGSVICITSKGQTLESRSQKYSLKAET